MKTKSYPHVTGVYGDNGENPGYIPNLGGFNGGPDAIERFTTTLSEAVRDVRAAMTGHVVDAQQFSPMAELAKWRRWATGLLDDDGFVGDEEQRHKLSALERIAKAATAFVDEQGKRVSMTPDGDMVLSDRHDFAGEQFAMLVAAIPEAGR